MWSDVFLLSAGFADQIFTVARMLFINVAALFFLLTLPSFLSHDSSLAAGSYVALTVLGRPPGLPHISLEEDDEEENSKGEGADLSPPSSVSAPHSPALPGGEQCSLQEHSTSSLPDGVRKKNECANRAVSLY